MRRGVRGSGFAAGVAFIGRGGAARARVWGVALLLSLAACSAPEQLRGTAITADPGPRAAPFVTDAELARQAQREYRNYLDAARRRGVLPAAPAIVARVRRITDRLTAVADEILPAARNWEWKLAVLDGEGDDAWCLPGGGMVVEARLAQRFAGDDDALASLIAHGIAHALLGHARERSPMLADPAHPFSPAHESEADRIGVELAARAGFNPLAAARAIRALSVPQGSASSAAEHDDWPRIHPSYDGRFADLATYSARVEPLYHEAASR